MRNALPLIPLANLRVRLPINNPSRRLLALWLSRSLTATDRGPGPHRYAASPPVRDDDDDDDDCADDGCPGISVGKVNKSAARARTQHDCCCMYVAVSAN